MTAVVVPVTPYGRSAPIVVTSASGISAFAGPRDDPFFFDLDQFHKITGGTATGFNNPRTDTFAGTNVMSVVVEVPKSLLNSTGKIGVWLRTAQNPLIQIKKIKIMKKNLYTYNRPVCISDNVRRMPKR